MKNTTSEQFHTQIIERIKEECITPHSRRYFIIKSYVMWSFFACIILLGSIIVSIDIHLISSVENDLQEIYQSGFLNFLFVNLPYFWLILTIGFIAIVTTYYKQTKKGYRHKITSVIVFGVIVMGVLGYIFHLCGIGKFIEDKISDSSLSTYYEPIIYNKYDIWLRPHEGYYIGTITEKVATNTLRFITIKGDSTYNRSKNTDNSSSTNQNPNLAYINYQGEIPSEWILQSSSSLSEYNVGDKIKIYGTTSPKGYIQTFIIHKF